MSVKRIASACIDVGKVVPVFIEVDIQRGLPQCTIIGLPDRRIDEARERMRLAIKNSGFPFPSGRITINLTPSSLHKQGTSLDLAMALGVLAAAGIIPEPPLHLRVFGELSLDGRVQVIQGITTYLDGLSGGSGVFMIPTRQVNELHTLSQVRIIPVATLSEAAETIRLQKPGYVTRQTRKITKKNSVPIKYAVDLIRGNEGLKRVMLIALCGRFNVFLSGPAGSGKTMIAHAASELLPPLSNEEAHRLFRLKGAGGDSDKAVSKRPYRAPHASITKAGLIGGGMPLVPGEISLASGGLLFIDEFPLLSRSVRESLRQPLQEKVVRFVRKGRSVSYPADCMVWVAENTCPCGRSGVPELTCCCTPADKARYQRSVSEPLIDRFHLCYTVPYLTGQDWEDSARNPAGLTGRFIQETVAKSWDETSQELLRSMPIDTCAEKVLWRAVDRLRLSMRATEHVKAVARIIAYLANNKTIGNEAVHEALQYRYRKT